MIHGGIDQTTEGNRGWLGQQKRNQKTIMQVTRKLHVQFRNRGYRSDRELPELTSQFKIEGTTAEIQFFLLTRRRFAMHITIAKRNQSRPQDVQIASLLKIIVLHRRGDFYYWCWRSIKNLMQKISELPPN